MNNHYQNQNLFDNHQIEGKSSEKLQGGNEVSGMEKIENNLLQGYSDSNNHAALHKASIRHNEVTQDMKKTYEEIFNSHGVDAANNWLKQQIVNNHINIQMDNEAVIKELQAKHTDLYSIPAVQQAIQAYIAMDLDPSISLRDQGLHDVADHIASIYRAGYEDALGLKAQNDSAKARMSSAVNSAVPHYQSNKIFTRADIKSMSPAGFARNEKAIFEQLNKGLIK